MRKVVLLLAALLVLIPVAGADIADEIRTLDGSGNNRNHPEWGKTNTQYLRVARTNYADGIAKPVGGPSTRYVSNRIFNDVHQNLFSENGVTQWGFVWGQFLDHTFGLRQEAGGETREHPVQHGRSAGDLHATPRRRSRSCARRPRRVRASERRRGSRSTRSRATSTAASVYGGTDTPAGLAARGAGGRQPGQQRRDAAAAQRLPAPRRRSAATPARRRPTMALTGGSRRRAPAKAFVAGRRAGEREHRAHRHPHAVRARAQPDRRRAARASCPRS